MKLDKARKRDRKRNKRRQWKQDSGRSVFLLEEIKRKRARQIARKEQYETGDPNGALNELLQ
jgi:hypothetical protein